MEKAEKSKWLGTNQTGGIKDISAIEMTVINEFIIETHMLKG